MARLPPPVAGIDRYPRKITKAMDEKKVAKRSLMKPFIKAVNYTHMMPTRYQVMMGGRGCVGEMGLPREPKAKLQAAWLQLVLELKNGRRRVSERSFARAPLTPPSSRALSVVAVAGTV